MPHEDIAKLVKESRTFLSLQPGESYVGFFVSHQVVPDKFKISENPNAKAIEYVFIDKNGKKIKWQKAATSSVHTPLGQIDHGSGVSITMIAKGKYEIRKLDVQMPKELADIAEQVPF